MEIRLGGYALALAGGLLTGALYFGGLWLTTRRVLRARNPALFLVGSYLVRACMTLALFYVFMDGSGMKLLVCLAGFLIMRQILVRHLGSAKNKPALSRPGGESA
jgi:F1F0 ATPase subunit 2